ncbi:MAG: hypothetical protein K2K19_06600, partial [Acetatifactor sp.]|nr:hypothetical protein [Acetatifactor sp.]
YQLFSETLVCGRDIVAARECVIAVYPGAAYAHRGNSLKKGFAKTYECSQCNHFFPVLAPVSARQQ